MYRGHAAGKTESRKDTTIFSPTADLRGGCGKAFEAGGRARGLKARDPANRRVSLDASEDE